MSGVWPDIIQAVGGAIAIILAAWNARQARQIADLRADLDTLTVAERKSRTLLRVAVRHIREWNWWAMTPEPRGPTPVTPVELTDEL
ncbi:hypothetical protein [Rhodococcus jostii]|uniref:hypothetical protein n=1 Tax=Rhodococcus jostii TaxID=132919 RepID=UPI003625B9B0